MNEHPTATTVRNESGEDVPQRQLTGVVVDLWSHADALIRQELALVKAEYEARLQTAKAALLRGTIAAALFYAAYLTTLAGIVLVLAQWVPAWLAALVVGAIAAAGAVSYVHLTKRALDATTRPTLASRSHASGEYDAPMQSEPNHHQQAQSS
ncbi:MAG TPA: phage holin family protein [Polyangiales bacterium]|nr:phage holin family protein [Polyangiales bacterium]